MKASAKQAVVKKLVTLLKKRYGKSLSKNDRPVLETIVYAVCLENTTSAVADENYARLSGVFHDLNEIRVW
jgi:endonuclease-3